MQRMAQTSCQSEIAVHAAAKAGSPVQVHIKVALRPAVQGVASKEDALELIEFIGACSSLQLRGLAADYGLPEVCPSPTSFLRWSAF